MEAALRPTSHVLFFKQQSNLQLMLLFSAFSVCREHAGRTYSFLCTICVHLLKRDLEIYCPCAICTMIMQDNLCCPGLFSCLFDTPEFLIVDPCLALQDFFHAVA